MIWLLNIAQNRPKIIKHNSRVNRSPLHVVKPILFCKANNVRPKATIVHIPMAKISDGALKVLQAAPSIKPSATVNIVSKMMLCGDCLFTSPQQVSPIRNPITMKNAVQKTQMFWFVYSLTVSTKNIPMMPVITAS